MAAPTQAVPVNQMVGANTGVFTTSTTAQFLLQKPCSRFSAQFTQAGGTGTAALTLQVSLDGVNWFTRTTSTVGTATATSIIVETTTASNAVGSYQYVQLTATTSGTTTSSAVYLVAETA